MDAGGTGYDWTTFATEYWTLANVVCAFAIVQMIAYLMALGASDSKIRSGVVDIRPIIKAAIIGATFLYVVVVSYFAWCHWVLAGSDYDDAERILVCTAVIRALAIVAAGAGGLYVTHLIERTAPSEASVGPPG